MGAGRPTDYRPEYSEQAYKLCLLGHTDKELADFFEVVEATIYNWKNDFPEFLEATKRGKQIADGEVVASLYKRATGYKTTEVHRHKVEGQAFDTEIDENGLNFVPNTDDTVLTKVIHKEVIPDVTAQIFWLKNRQRQYWKDKKDLEQSGYLGLGVNVTKEEAKDISDALENEV